MYNLEFYARDNGRQPAKEFIDGLPEPKKGTLLAAIQTVLAKHGKDVCTTEYGKNLGTSLYEFRVRDDGVLIRVYFHPHGQRMVLLLAGYDKGRFGSGRREQNAIKQARKFLADYKRNPPT